VPPRVVRAPGGAGTRPRTGTRPAGRRQASGGEACQRRSTPSSLATTSSFAWVQNAIAAQLFVGEATVKSHVTTCCPRSASATGRRRWATPTGTDPSLPVPSAGSIARVKTSADLDGDAGEESETGSANPGGYDPPQPSSAPGGKPFPPDPLGPPRAQARLVVAVDGPSGAGKSSASRGAAIALGVRYLDTGSMYRALTWWLLERGVQVSDADLVGELAAEPVIEVGTDPRAPWTRVNGTDVSAAIRTREVTSAVSAVAAVPEVRAHLIAQQRDIIAKADGIVAEGRDIGTVVAPDAPVKVFLTADSAARADRRAAETSRSAAPTQVEQDRRDHLDTAQSGQADDAVQIDSTQLDLDQVVDIIVRLARERVGVPQSRQQIR
jgi:CMP/dCMP kinase